MNSKSACRSIATARPSRRGLKARKKLRGRTSLTSHGNRLPRGLRGQHSLRGRKGFDPHHAMQFIQGQDWLGLNNYIEDALLQAGFGRVNAARMSTSWVGDWSGAQWPASSFIGQLQQVSDIIGRGPESYRPGMGLYKRLSHRGRKAAPEGSQDAEWETNGRWFRRQGGRTVRISGPGGQKVPQEAARTAAESPATSADTQRHQAAMQLTDWLEKMAPEEGRDSVLGSSYRAAYALSQVVGLTNREDIDTVQQHIARKIMRRYGNAEMERELADDPGVGRRHWATAQIITQQLLNDLRSLHRVLEHGRIQRMPEERHRYYGYREHKDYTQEVGPSHPGEFEVRVDSYTGKSLRRRKGLVRRKAHARSIVTTRPKKCCKSLGGLSTLARSLSRVASKGWAIADNAGLQVYTKSGWQPRALVQHKSLDNAYLFRTQRDAEAFCTLHTLNGFADRI